MGKVEFLRTKAADLEEQRRKLDSQLQVRVVSVCLSDVILMNVDCIQGAQQVLPVRGRLSADTVRSDHIRHHAA